MIRRRIIPHDAKPAMRTSPRILTVLLLLTCAAAPAAPKPASPPSTKDTATKDTATKDITTKDITTKDTATKDPATKDTATKACTALLRFRALRTEGPIHTSPGRQLWDHHDRSGGALQGRLIGAFGHGDESPLQGSFDLGIWIPGLAPWADMNRAFGPQTAIAETPSRPEGPTDTSRGLQPPDPAPKSARPEGGAGNQPETTSVIHAPDPAAKAPALDPIAATIAPPSHFESARLSRNPFERIDAEYLARKSVVAITAPVAPAAPVCPDLTKFLRVTSLSLGQPAIAIINGHAFAENETLTVRSGKQDFRVLVKRITAQGAELESAGTAWKIPMSRADAPTDDKTLEVATPK